MSNHAPENITGDPSGDTQKHHNQHPRGFIALGRDWFQSHYLISDPDRFVRLLDLACEATHQPRKFLNAGKVIELQPGQCFVSIRRLADRWGWSRSKVERFIHNLEVAGDVKTEPQAGREQTILTICHYAELFIASKDSKSEKPKKRDASGTRSGHKQQQEQQNNKGSYDPSTDGPPAHLTPKKDPMLSADIGYQVWMTDAEVDERVERWGKIWFNAMLQSMSVYAQSQPDKWRKYKNHAATFDAWSRSAKARGDEAKHDLETGVYVFSRGGARV